MTATQPTHTPWEIVATADVPTPALVADAVTSMEIARSRYMDEHLPAARRIIDTAIGFGRPDLAMRARLIVADVDARKGASGRAARDIDSVIEWATMSGDRYVLARAHFLQCIVQYSRGDRPAARIHGIRSVELLPERAPTAVRIDHLIMLAVSYGPGAEADMHYRHALDLTAAIGDTAKTIGIHNNLAYTAAQAGDHAAALAHVEQMIELAELRDVPLKASALDTVARVYIDAGRYRDAVDVLTPATTANSTIPSTSGIGVLHTEPYALPACLITLAEAHRKLGNFEDAATCLDRADWLAAERQLGQTAADALQERARLLAARGDWQAAYQLHVTFHQRSAALYTREQEARARAVQASYDADERQRDAARFRELAIRDPLTGLYNRRFIDEQLAALTAQSVARGTPLSAAIVDADFFKRVNDECSHEVGDKVLQSLAGILEVAVVAPETVGRLGGEEFVILMPGCSAQEAFDRCEEVRLAVHQNDWTPLVGAIPVTVSIGVSTASTGQTSAAALLSDADRNLYAAKRSGRNRVMSDAR